MSLPLLKEELFLTKVSGRMNSEAMISGPILHLEEPLSFWGGLDPATGVITDIHHPQVGVCVTGKILVMEHGRGSSSSSSVVLELIRNKAGPVAIILLEMDTHIVLGSIAAEELYGLLMPIIVVSRDILESLHTGDIVNIDPTNKLVSFS